MDTNDTPSGAEEHSPGFGTLPAWAVRAFRLHEPTQDSGAMECWDSLRGRFVSRWHDLKVDRWKVPDKHACYADLRRHLIYPPTEYVRQCILETAIECVLDSTDPVRSEQARKELDSLNDQITLAAQNLSQLLRQRSTLLDSYPVEDRPEWEKVDRVRLWESFCEILKGPAFIRLNMTYRDVIDPFVHLMRKSGSRSPNWCDLLDSLTLREPRSVISDPGIRAAVSSSTNSTEWSRWGRRLLGLMDGWEGFYPAGFLAGCLTYEQLSLLAEISSGAPEHAFSSEQMRKLIKGHRQADDSTR